MNRNQFKLPYLLLILSLIYHSCDDSGNDTDPCQNGPEISIDNVVSSIEGQDDGELSVSATGGNAPYQYSLDGMTFQASGAFTDLAAGDYTVSVKDVNGCTNTAMASIAEVPIVSYANQIRPIIDANCQVSPCHGSNGNIPSFATYDDVKAKANGIKNRTSNKTMPPNGALSDANIKLIADWVDQGTPNN